MDVRDAACLVTGGSSGIGRATALALARAGARVTVIGRDAERVAEAAAACGGRAIVADLATPEGVDRVVTEAGAVDVLVNNAGLGSAGPLAAMTAEAIELLVRVNLVAPALLTRALLPGMLARGRGHVVNVASVAGHVPVKGEVALRRDQGAASCRSRPRLRQELAATPGAGDARQPWRRRHAALRARVCRTRRTQAAPDPGRADGGRDRSGDRAGRTARRSPRGG